MSNAEIKAKISDEYLSLLRNSRRQLDLAHANNEFVEKNLAQTYQLGPEDLVSLDTGEITRKPLAVEPKN